MSKLIYQWALQKTGLASAIKIGDPNDDPYKEPIPTDELKFYQKPGAKRKKPIPAHFSKHDQKVLRSVRDRAHLLDLAFSICGVRFGLAGLIGLIPWVGDVVAVVLALMLVKTARKVDGGLPEVIQAKMMANLSLDFGIGLIPLVGDFINIAYKSNTRNYLILLKYLNNKYNLSNAVEMLDSMPQQQQQQRIQEPQKAHAANSTRMRSTGPPEQQLAQ